MKDQELPTTAPRHAEASDHATQALQTRSQVWSRHWASGAAHSCVGSFGSTYGDELAAFWRSVFLCVTPGHRVLDIGTGNGALPRLLLTAQPATAWHCDAVDCATIAPAWAIQQRSGAGTLQFHSGVSAESLPFAPQTFQLVTSQYGIEYADLSRALPEVLRVLAPGGHVAFVLHHHQSRPVVLAEIEIAHIDWLLSQEGLLSATGPLLEPLSRAATPQGLASLEGDQRAEAARENFNSAQEELKRRSQVTDGADVLFEAQAKVAEVLNVLRAKGLESASAQLQESRSALLDARWRLDELRAHALTPKLAGQIAATLQQQLQIATMEPIRTHGHLMGWAVLAGRSA